MWQIGKHGEDSRGTAVLGEEGLEGCYEGELLEGDAAIGLVGVLIGKGVLEDEGVLSACDQAHAVRELGEEGLYLGANGFHFAGFAILGKAEGFDAADLHDVEGADDVGDVEGLGGDESRDRGCGDWNSCYDIRGGFVL